MGMGSSAGALFVIAANSECERPLGAGSPPPSQPFLPLQGKKGFAPLEFSHALSVRPIDTKPHNPQKRVFLRTGREEAEGVAGHGAVVAGAVDRVRDGVVAG